MSSRAAEDDITAVRPMIGCCGAKQLGTAADEIVLSEVAEDNVVAAAAFDIVVTVSANTCIVVGRHVVQSNIKQHVAGQRQGCSVALNRIIAKLPKDRVVFTSPGNDVTAVELRTRGRCVIKQRHRPLIHGAWIGLWSHRNAALTIDAQQFWSNDRSPSCIRCARLPMNPGVVASDVVMTFTAIDQVLIVIAIGHVMAADDVVITRFAVDAIASLTADDDVFTGSCQNEIVSAEVRCLSCDRRERKVW